MSIDHAQLAALVAVIREGSFEAAARSLHVTPSAVSQRIKQLEGTLGGIVVVRGACTPTSLGEALYRHGLQLELLEKDLERAMQPQRPEASPPIGVAVNADSLATWLVPALGAFTAQTGQSVDLALDDQDHTADWLRSGRVLGAVTVEAKAVQGCRVEALGIMRYRAVATGRFIRRWFANGVTEAALEQAPVVAFNRKDLLHEQFTRSLLGRRVRTVRIHFMPSPQGIVQATIAGMGWGLNPELLLRNVMARRQVRDVVPGKYLDVPLYWQQWALSSISLDALAGVMKAQAARALRPV